MVVGLNMTSRFDELGPSTHRLSTRSPGQSNVFQLPGSHPPRTKDATHGKHAAPLSRLLRHAWDTAGLFYPRIGAPSLQRAADKPNMMCGSESQSEAECMESFPTSPCESYTQPSPIPHDVPTAIIGRRFRDECPSYPMVKVPELNISEERSFVTQSQKEFTLKSATNVPPVTCPKKSQQKAPKEQK